MSIVKKTVGQQKSFFKVCFKQSATIAILTARVNLDFPGFHSRVPSNNRGVLQPTNTSYGLVL